MSPLQQIARGLIIVALTAPLGGVDLLADPIGWLLVVGGLVRLPGRRPATVGAGVVALAVSAALAVPAVRDDASEEVLAILTLPQSLCCLLLSLGLASLAGDGAETGWRRWFLGLAAAFAVVSVLPVVVVAGLEQTVGAVSFVGVVALLTLVVLLFRVHAEPWVAESRVAEGGA